MLRIDHIDLAVRDVGRSLRFYLAVLGPLGLHEWRHSPIRGDDRVGASRSRDRHGRVPVEHTSWLHNALPPGDRGSPLGPV
jgi:catechol 2,3-dioxygenase-like lactoylglutathione lyase family enzyme